ncbi:MAG: hypothetical protein KDA91_23260 [Planctomycetaceae bacterium]|nr:hypothetical protein [Planctomycetaceae bacterium]
MTYSSVSHLFGFVALRICYLLLFNMRFIAQVMLIDADITLPVDGFTVLWNQ